MRELRLVDRRSRERYSVQRLGEFVARCRKRGLAVTPQRLAVIRALLASENHPSPHEICAAVRRRHPHVSLTLRKLRFELVRRMMSDGDLARADELHQSPARWDRRASS